MDLVRVILNECSAIAVQGKYLLEQLVERPNLEEDVNQCINFDHSLVLLIHGLFVGNSTTLGCSKYLRKKGYNTLQISYSHLHSLFKVEDEICNMVEQICFSDKKVSLVGHSQGGLLAYGIAQLFPEGVDKVIGLGTPYRGVKYIGKIGLKQIDQEGSYIKKLQQRGFPETVKFISISGDADFLAPPSKTFLPTKKGQIRNVVVKDVGHCGLLSCNELIYKFLSEKYL